MSLSGCGRMPANLSLLSAELRQLQVQMSPQPQSARLQFSQRSGLLLVLRDCEGRIGLGEASPLPGYSGEDLAQCLAQLQTVSFAPLVTELPYAAGLPDLVQLGQRVDALALPAAAGCAVQTALLDLLGQQLQLPVTTLLGGAVSTVPVSGLVVGDTPEQLLASAQLAWSQGLRVLKVKLGRPGQFEAELALLKELRAQLGPTLRLRLDGNGAFTLREAVPKLHALASLVPEVSVELLEEPLQDARELALLPASVLRALPLALDESLQVLPTTDVERLLASGVVRALVCKPMALGGPLRCLKLAALAQKYGAATVVTHLFDGPVALAMTAALALCMPGVLACGLAAHVGLKLWPSVTVPQLQGARIASSLAPGLQLHHADSLAASLATLPLLWQQAERG